jgi:hypothetical protein
MLVFAKKINQKACLHHPAQKDNSGKPHRHFIPAASHLFNFGLCAQLTK